MTSTAILSVDDVTVSFDGFRVLDALRFSMQPGELRFLIGPNGAGKTTLLDIITGRTRPTSGRVLFDGRLDVSRCAEHQLVRHGIGRKFQTPALFPSLTVAENLTVAAGFRQSLAQQLWPLPAAQCASIATTLEQIGLTARAAVRAGTLAHGEKQWLELGMLLIQRPRLLLLDEPVAGMTRRERDHTGQLLLSIARTCSVLVVEHDMTFVRQFATTVTVLHGGRVLCEGPMDQIQRDPRVIEVYLGPTRERVA